ncbi:hypothetical protein [Proteus mirabilis]|nr:hypothetical protein [Proteus mirabilis]
MTRLLISTLEEMVELSSLVAKLTSPLNSLSLFNASVGDKALISSSD